MQKLIDHTLALITEQCEWSQSPCVAWSSGKDSQVMLWLVRQVKPNIDVLYFPGFPHPTKHKFALQIVRDWDLEVYFPLARERDVVAKDGQVEIVELFELAPNRFMYFPIEAPSEYIPDQSSCCAIDKLNEMRQQELMNYDMVFVGHRNDDVDPTYGAVPLINYVIDCGDFRYVYPLRDWTEADIWGVSESHNIPQNQARYNGDLTANNDYYSLCTRCLGSDLSSVICPKTGAKIPVLMTAAELNERRQAWIKTFVNIERKEKR